MNPTSDNKSISSDNKTISGDNKTDSGSNKSVADSSSWPGSLFGEELNTATPADVDLTKIADNVTRAAAMPGKVAADTINIIIPPDSYMKSKVDKLYKQHVKEELSSRLKRFTDSLKTLKIRPVNEKGDPAPKSDHVITLLEAVGAGATKKPYQLSKTDLATILAILTSIANRALLRESQPEYVSRLEDYIAEHGLADISAVRKICGQKSVVEKSSNWWSGPRYELSAALNEFIIWRDYERVDVYGRLYGSCSGFYLANPAEYASNIAREFYSKRLRPLSGLTPEQLEKCTIIEMMPMASVRHDLIRALMESGIVVPGASKLLTKSQYKRIENTIYPAINENPLSPLDHRLTELLALSMIMAQKYKKKTTRWKVKTADPVKSGTLEGLHKAFLAIQNIEEEPQMVSSMLTDMEGISRSDLRASSVRYYLNKVCDILRESPADTWLDIEEIKMKFYLMILESNGLGLTRFCGFHSRPWSNPLTGVAVMPEQALERITFPLLRGILATFASLGMLDIYVWGDNRNIYPFNNILYVRLTPLGLYFLGRDKEPDLRYAANFVHQYELLETPLMVIGKKENNPYDSWLNNVARRVAGRWIVTTSTFLAQVTRVQEIDRLISDFKKYISADLPPAWEKFFERISRNSGAGVATQDKTAYDIFELDKSNKELLAYLSACPELETLAIKAEGCRLLVRRTEISRFQQILKDGGFTIDI